MLARSITVLGLCCLALCACKPRPSKMAKCEADGGCPDASLCEDGGMCESDEKPGPSGRDDVPAAGSGGQRSRTQAARAATDAGMGMAMKPDAAQASQPREAAQQPKATPKAGAAGAAGSDTSSAPKAQQPGAGGSGGGAAMTQMMGMPMDPAQAGQGGAASEPSAECEVTCEACQACGADNKTCEPVTGADDADSCSDTRSCSSRGVCLDVSQAQTDLGSMLEYAELTTSYAQVISFSEPASIQEIRLEVSCTENDQSFPPAWIVAAPGGVPSSTVIATAIVQAQAPTEKNTFALLELSKVLEEPDVGPIAVVVGMTDMNCLVRVNSENAYPGGELFMQSTAGLWLPSEGSMVFQVLSSK